MAYIDAQHLAMPRLLLTLFLFLSSVNCPATTVQSVSLQTMAQQSELVFEGRVIGQRVEADRSQRSIRTWVEFEILDIVKGRYTGSNIELAFLGGRFGDIALQIGDMHLPSLGEQGIFFVEQLNHLQVHPLLGWDQGHFIVSSDPATRKVIVKTYDESPVYAVSATPRAVKQKQAFSTGVAMGIRTKASTAESSPLSPEQFKQRLRVLLSEADSNAEECRHDC